MASSTVPRRGKPRRGRTDGPLFQTSAQRRQYAEDVLEPYAQLLWERRALDHARAYPGVVAMRWQLELLRLHAPDAYRAHYRRFFLALAWVDGIVVLRSDGEFDYHPAPELDQDARHGYVKLMDGVLDAAGLLPPRAPHERVWLRELVAHLLLAMDCIQTAGQLLTLPPPWPLPFHAELSRDGVLRIEREPDLRYGQEGILANRHEGLIHEATAPRPALPRKPTQARQDKQRRRWYIAAFCLWRHEAGWSDRKIESAIGRDKHLRALARKAGVMRPKNYAPTERTIRDLIAEARAMS